MVKWKNGYLTRRALSSEIKQVVAAKHNLCPSEILINWLSKWRVVKYPTGLIAKVAKIKLHAVDFHPRIYIVHQNKNQKWYMR